MWITIKKLTIFDIKKFYGDYGQLEHSTSLHTLIKHIIDYVLFTPPHSEERKKIVKVNKI
ncbi:CLUMA_CG001665, isoform A [Clunio marinus]|uniref:CLUMA_CG001665, isoform A n=1 Tax=Clunio marinus TaxID=568069 RepID=A0A1J1HN35_9DIPT|nr:CLUMA_CG001665, isoform A [Clunio marinus]